MGIEVMSAYMHQITLQNEVSISVMKLTMNTRDEMATQITNMISNMAVDPNRGANLDTRV